MKRTTIFIFIIFVIIIVLTIGGCETYRKIYRKHKVKFIWVKGHAGNEKNEICDQLAVAASHSKNLKTDDGYEIKNDNQKELFD